MPKWIELIVGVRVAANSSFFVLDEGYPPMEGKTTHGGLKICRISISVETFCDFSSKYVDHVRCD